MTFKTKLLHLRIKILGDRKLESKGRVIECKECDKLFKSYTHYGEWSYTYDDLCDDCRKKKEELMKLKMKGGK